MKIEIDLPEIEGFEYTGLFRVPEVDEYYLNKEGFSHHCVKQWHGMHCYFILRKIVPKREFKDGAFYPVQMDGLNKVVYAELSPRSNPIFWTGDECCFIESAFSWIGEELNINWEE